MLTYLDEPYELIPVNLEKRDPELLELSPTGKVPFMIDGELRLFESEIINDYLAAKLGWEEAYQKDIEVRSLQKLLMKQWDGTILPAFYASLGNPNHITIELAKSLRKEFDWMTETVRRMEGIVENMPGFHCAPHWTRMGWLREHSRISDFVDGRPELKEWLGRSIAIPAIRQTLPDRATTVTAYRRKYIEV